MMEKQFLIIHHPIIMANISKQAVRPVSIRYIFELKALAARVMNMYASAGR